MVRLLRLAGALMLTMMAVVAPAHSDDGGNDRIVHGDLQIGFGDPSHFILIKPKTPISQKKWPLFIFMHGQGWSPENVLRTNYELLTQQDFNIVLPQAPTRQGDGFSWYDRQDRNQFVADLGQDEKFIQRMIDRLIETDNVDSSKIVLSGFSQGGRVAFFVGFRNPTLFSEIAPIAGGYDSDLLDGRLDDLGMLRINIFHGTMDDRNSFEDMRKTYIKLKQAGANVTLTTYPLGHTYTTEILNRVLRSVD